MSETSSFSAQGVVTLLVLVFAGPLVWGVIWFQGRGHAEANAPRVSETRRRLSSVSAIAASFTSNHKAHWRDDREEVDNISYLLGLLGYAIGIGNLWRFPYLVGKWGGCSFVLAYLCCLALVSAPAYLMEMVMGQYTRMNTLDCFRAIRPRWVGLAWSQSVMIFCALCYYNVLLAYALIYVAGSLFDPLPWATDSSTYWNEGVLNNYGNKNYTDKGLGEVQPKIAGSLLVVWVIVFLALAFGKDVLAKVTWVTVVGPIVMLLVLLVRAVNLPGASDGIAFYILKFDYEKFMDYRLWVAACGQILFSLSPGMGTAITMSSYTKPKQDVFKTCMTVAASNSLFSLTGGFAIFSIVGNIVYRKNELNPGANYTVAEESKAGTGLAFITLADGMHTFGSTTNMMAVVFFVVLLTLGLDSTFAWAETLVSYIEDACLKTGRRIPKWQIVLPTCLILFVCGLPFCTRMGNELLDVIDHFVAGYVLMLGVALESLMFTLDFTWKRFDLAVKMATWGNPTTPVGRNLAPEAFWRFAIQISMPVICVILFCFSMWADLRKAYESYPFWLNTIGWLSLGVCALAIPVGTALNLNDVGSLNPLDEEQRALNALQGDTNVRRSLNEASVELTQA